MSSIELNDVTSGYNLGKISDNFDKLERVVNEELLHRVNGDGGPNSMETDLDMNGQHIYNLPKPVTSSSPLRVKDLFGDSDELLQGPEGETIVSVAGQQLFNLSSSYVIGTNSLLVFRNGLYQYPGEDYTESSTTSITFTAPLDVGDVVAIVPVAVTGGSVSEGDSVTVASNVGTGQGIYSNKSGNTLLLKSVKAGTGVTVTSTPTEVVVSASNPSLTASNLAGIGEVVYAGKVGDDFQFKRLRAGTNVSLSSDASGVTINASGGGGGGGGGDIAIYDNGVLKTSDVGSINFINTIVGGAGGAITVQAPGQQYLNVKDYGALGDGVTNDSAAIQTAINTAKAANKSLFFPDGSYVISSLGTQNGRVFLIGTGNSTLKGTFTYYDATFPTSADTNTPLSPTSPYFSAQGINFQSTTSDYGLKLSTIYQGGFLSTFNLSHCRFYGNKGILAQHMIGFELSNCEFNNVVSGIRLEGCVNGLFVNCRWQNQAESGVWITENAGNNSRTGGENMKFVLCEWAVCTFGLVADQHMWLAMDSCLMDYCGAPLFLSGSKYAKASNSYFGASNVPVTRFSAVPGFISPGSGGVAVFARPGGTPVGNRTVGFTAHNCEFINYNVGSTNPIISIDGYINGTYPQSAEYVSFYDCLFFHPVPHSAATILYIKSSSIVRVIGNRFVSFNQSSSLIDPWRAESCVTYQGFSNDFSQCTQSGIAVPSSYESFVGTIISASDPGARGPGVTWVQP